MFAAVTRTGRSVVVVSKLLVKRFVLSLKFFELANEVFVFTAEVVRSGAESLCDDLCAEKGDLLL